MFVVPHTVCNKSVASFCARLSCIGKVAANLPPSLQSWPSDAPCGLCMPWHSVAPALRGRAECDTCPLGPPVDRQHSPRHTVFIPIGDSHTDADSLSTSTNCHRAADVATVTAKLLLVPGGKCTLHSCWLPTHAKAQTQALVQHPASGWLSVLVTVITLQL